ncbi:MAG: hypothetical protein WC554_05475 [Clostridia bacterium]|jgi:hypothetical protein
MTDQPVINIVELAKQFREALAKRDNKALTQIINAYGDIYSRLQDKINLLTLQIAAMDPPTAAAIRKLDSYKSLVVSIEQELTKFQGYAGTVMQQSASDAVKLGVTNARTLTLAGNPAVSSVWRNLNPTAIESLVSYFGEGSPLMKRLDTLAGENALKVAQTIIDNVALGNNPKTIAGLIRQSLGGGLTDALRMTRTVQLYSYREANRASYVANGDVVKGWYWMSALDPNSCMSCIAMHGTFHTNDEVLNDHHNGLAEVEGNVILSDDTTALESINYDGDIIIIRTASGKLLSVTPNHPVLTDRGWIAAAFIHKGCNVISANIREGTSINVSPDKNYVPTSVENIPASLGMVFVGVPESSKNFDSNREGGKVDAIFIDRLLWDSFNTPKRQHGLKLPFGFRHFSDFFPCNCGFDKGFDFTRNSNSGNLSSADAVSLLFGGHKFIPKRNCFGRCMSSDIFRFNNSSNNISRYTEKFSNGIFGFTGRVSRNDFAFRKPSDLVPGVFGDFPALDFRTFGGSPKQPLSLEVIRESMLRSVPFSSSDFRTITSQVILDRVINVDTRRFSGHVYSLQTQKEWYYSNSIISHNCVMIPAVIGSKSPFEENAGQKFFDSLSESEQKRMMGEGKLEAYKDGKFEFSQLSTEKENDVYGLMRSETSLKDLIGE